MYLKYRKNSLVGRIYFWYYKATKKWKPYEEDSCHVRGVVLFSAPWAWFVTHRVFGTRIRPWVIAVEVAFVTLSLALPYVLAAIFVKTTLVVLGVAAVLLIIFGLGRLARLVGSIASVVKRWLSASSLGRVWDWFWEAMVFKGRVPLWLVVIPSLYLALQVAAYVNRLMIVFWIMAAIEIVFAAAFLIVALIIANEEWG